MKSATLLLLCASFLLVRAEARTSATASSDQKDAAKVEQRAQAAATMLSDISTQTAALVQGTSKDFSIPQASK